MRGQLETLFKKVFKSREGTPLYEAAWKIAMEMLNLNLHQQRTTMAVEILADEVILHYPIRRQAYTE